MNIEKVEIRKRASYEDNAGRYVAKIHYASSNGNIEMPLTPEISERLLEFLAPLIARFGSEAANAIANEIYKAVEDQKSPAITVGAES